MYAKGKDKSHFSSDVSAFVETVRSRRELFVPGVDVYIARAPGRLDVMGGIADYSGSLVLEMPIAEAAFAAVQPSARKHIKIVSVGSDVGRAFSFEMPLDDLLNAGEPILYGESQEYFRQDPATAWAAYIAGAFLVLMREKAVRFSQGARILLDSGVPLGKGVSSSAAIEVAAMTAITGAFEIAIEPREMAILCQIVENHVVGAPCGIMDQMSSVAGEENRLLAMVCQPAELRGTVAIPDGAAFWGIDSGIRHSVGSGDYGSVRTGAFMGYRIIADLAGLHVSETSTDGVAEIADDKWSGYLANISPGEFERDYADSLPETISGADFLARYKGITDRVTKVDPTRDYAVLNPTKHPLYENARVRKFGDLLGQPAVDATLNELGHLMYESHQSYSDCGLGTDGTDLLVNLVRRSDNLFGAKITGGGSGGTIAVLGRSGADAEIETITKQYEKETGRRPYKFSGSSAGAATFGTLRLSL